jgi:hypothetical protein
MITEPTLARLSWGQSLRCPQHSKRQQRDPYRSKPYRYSIQKLPAPLNKSAQASTQNSRFPHLTHTIILPPCITPTMKTDLTPVSIIGSRTTDQGLLVRFSDNAFYLFPISFLVENRQRR